MPIQVDMYEVKLGAAILMTFELGSDPIHVLADGGVRNYPPDHVHKKLLRQFVRATPLRLDLIIGTHYDADHLEGLVPIIDDQASFTVGEAWLPAVLDDSEQHPSSPKYLAYRLRDDPGGLQDYLRIKATLCLQLQEVEMRLMTDGEQPVERTVIPENLEDLLQFLEKQYREAGEAAAKYSKDLIVPFETEQDHADHEIVPPLTQASAKRLQVHEQLGQLLLSYLHGPAHLIAGLNRSRLVSHLAQIRQATAKGAIVAKSLAKVVDALKRRSIPILCKTIPQGKPQRYTWNGNTKAFELAHGTPSGLELVLLAPSDSLVQRHAHRLPIGSYLYSAFTDVEPKDVSPSNELSYVLKFSAEDQSILITGDAGFVDFQDEHGTFYPELIKCLAPLHVIQIAHHAGANGYFYNSLLHSNFPSQKAKSYLLLSHGVLDAKRPSLEFRNFVLQLPAARARILFASEPRPQNVQGISSYVERDVGLTPADRGDVRLKYANGAWAVTQHAIRI